MSDPAQLWLRLLDVPIVLCLPKDLKDELRSMLSALGPGGHAGTDFPVAARRVELRRAGMAWSARFADDPAMYGDDPLGLAVTALTQVAVQDTALLGVHAAVVAGPDGTIVVPGPSGLGKSTLAACAVRAGFGYVSDEVLAVDRHTGVVHPFARPLALDAAAWRLAGLPEHRCPADGDEHLVRPEELGVVGPAAPVSDIVLAQRTDGAPTRLERTAPGEAVAALIRHSFNHYADPAGSFDCVTALVRSARVWRVTYGDAGELAAVLAARLPAAVALAPRHS